jgi:hypothetical protein
MAPHLFCEAETRASNSRLRSVTHPRSSPSRASLVSPTAVVTGCWVAVLFTTAAVSIIATTALSPRPRRLRQERAATTSREPSGILMGLTAVPTSDQPRHGGQVPARPAPVRANWPCPWGLWPSPLSGGTAAPEAGTSVRRLAPFHTLPRTAHHWGLTSPACTRGPVFGCHRWRPAWGESRRPESLSKGPLIG